MTTWLSETVQMILDKEPRDPRTLPFAVEGALCVDLYLNGLLTPENSSVRTGAANSTNSAASSIAEPVDTTTHAPTSVEKGLYDRSLLPEISNEEAAARMMERVGAHEQEEG